MTAAESGIELVEAMRTDADAVTQRLAALFDTLPADAPRLLEAMRYSALGPGKRLRPLLCLWTHDGLQPRRAPAVWSAALALEMAHTYSLIHDDLPAMDDDDLRRGQPANHRQFDEASAILAGDALQTEAFAQLATVEPRATAAELVGILAGAIGVGGMAAGQELDLAGRADPELIHRLKTGRLLGAALEMGACCAGSPDRELIRRAGEQVGVAFQIVDDVLDETASPDRLGKSAGKDRAQGKRTALTKWGSVERARDEARARLATAATTLRKAGIDAPRLHGLLEFLVERDH